MLNDVKTKAIERKNEFEFNGRKYTPQMILENTVIDLSSILNSALYFSNQ